MDGKEHAGRQATVTDREGKPVVISLDEVIGISAGLERDETTGRVRKYGTRILERGRPNPSEVRTVVETPEEVKEALRVRTA